MLGVLFALLSSASFGFNTAAIRRGVLGSSAAQGLYISVTMGVPLFLAAAAVTGQLGRFSAFSLGDYLLLTSAGVLHFVFGRYCNYRAISAIGANRTAPLQGFSILYSVVVAVVVLGEQVTLLNAVGILLLVAGPLIMVQGDLRKTRDRSPAGASAPASSSPVGGPAGIGNEGKTEPPASSSARSASAVAAASPPTKPAPRMSRLVEGYFFAVVSSVAYGTSPILVRAALRGTGLGILGGLVSYVPAAVVMNFTLLFPGRLASLRGMNRTAMRWFLIVGVSVFSAQMFRYIALDLAPVSVVAPLGQTVSVFGLFFAFLINRQTESFELPVIAGIAMSVIGSAAVVL
jgi:drug/metabolite transporter (DMT)-like permease